MELLNQGKGHGDGIDALRRSGMRIVRVLAEGDCRYGLADDDIITLISEDPFQAWEPEGTAAISEARLLAPVTPTKVVCVGLNYRGHAEELGHDLPPEPVLFLKPSTSVIGPDEPIVVPQGVGRVDHEAELAVVIGRRTHRAGIEEAAANVLGFACANDVTARDIQTRDGQWTRAKSFDTFCPVGPWIATAIDDPCELDVECLVNGEVRQSSNTADMIYSPFELVSYVSGIMTLVPGDIVLTGTPSGIGPIRPGDEVEVRISGIGGLRNPVIEAP